jgi:hypothetical protein
MNIAAYGHKFFIFGGIILIAVAVMQVLTRRREKGKPAALRLLDATTIRAVFFVVVGLLTLLVGVGVIPMGGGR